VDKNINTVVYRCGFAETQDEYNELCDHLFLHLDQVEEILSKNRFLTGSQFTEADIRLFVILIRFDVAYYFLFKANIKVPLFFLFPIKHGQKYRSFPFLLLPFLFFSLFNQ